MVAARRLRKSMLKDMPYLDINTIDSIKESKHKKVDLTNIKRNEKQEKEFKNIFKLNLIIKVFISSLILFICLTAKLFYKEQVIKNKYINGIIFEYNKDYSKGVCIEKIEEVVNISYEKLKIIIPDSIALKIKETYLLRIKPQIVDFELKTILKKFISNNDEVVSVTTINSSNINENTGMGGGEIASMSMELPDSSAEAIAMRDRVNAILEKNINIKKPVDGTITSVYGNREKIFEELSNYHTGIDIANKIGTNIYSATKGIVKSVEKNNKYYGNNIEIETDGVIFKYAHLKGFNVKQGECVNQDTLIGFMGSTGMSTGSHLHFEIRIGDLPVDPNMIIKFI